MGNKLIEISGTSSTSVEEAVFEAIQRAQENPNALRRLQVVETRTTIDSDKTFRWQVTLKLDFPSNGQSVNPSEALQLA